MKDVIILALIGVATIAIGMLVMPKGRKRIEEDRDAYKAKLSVQRGGSDMIKLHDLQQNLRYFVPLLILAFILIVALILAHR